MKKLIPVLFIFLFFPGQVSFGQVAYNYDHLKELYNQGKYREVYEQAVTIRKQQYGKNWKTDYFISKALCAANSKNLGLRAFDYTLTAYKRDLNNRQFEFLLSERDKCSLSQPAKNQYSGIVSLNISIIDNESSGVKGKMGYIVNCKTDPHTFSVDSAFDYQSLTRRIFPVGDVQSAVSYYRNFLGSGYTLTPRGRFLFITPAATAATDAAFNRIAGNLEQAYHFYASYFGLREPENLITVYLMNNRYNLRRVAKKTHGLTIPESNIGYSCLADLSLLGTSTTESLGTIVHELFHLMVRTDVGDIPTWLDEAVACLYETSKWKDNLLKGDIRQWRTELMHNLVVPRLDGLFTTRFNDFTSHGEALNTDRFTFHESNNNCEIALNYALVKHFAIYLQATGMLQPVVDGFKNRKNVMVDTLGIDETDIQVLEKVYNKPFVEIQADFDKWLSQNYPLTTNRSSAKALDFIRYAEVCSCYSLNSVREEMMQKLSGSNVQLTDEQIKEINQYIMEARFCCTH